MHKVLIIPFIFITPAFAYLDPGTGSMLLYFIMGIIATFIYFIKGIFYKIKSFISGGKIDKDLRDLSGSDILFYSEGGNYWNVFLPVIETLENKKVKNVYYTSDKNDPALSTNFKYMTAKYIGNDLMAFTLLKNIEAKVVIMTTPQLDILQLKRSKKVGHYVHLIHAPTDALIYKKFAFDYFDSVMCSGSHQIESIRKLEKKRNLPSKVLYETGLTYYDIMYRNRDKYLCNRNKKTILVAPTWGSNSLLTKFGAKPIKSLLMSGYNVILRPHPQMYISQSDLIKNIEQELSSFNNIEIDNSRSAENSMGKAEILISDISGIIFDFYFIYEKPVIVIKDIIYKGGLEAEDVEKEIWESSILEKVSTFVDHNNIDALPQTIETLIDKDITTNVEILRSRSLFNFPNAGEVAANQILEIIRN